MKKLLIIGFLLIGVGALAYTLYNNKNELEEAATLAMKSSEYISVTVEKVAEKDVNRNFEANGVFEPSQELKLMSETSGAIIKINKRKGDFVKKGDVIVQVDDRLIRADYTITKLNLEQAAKDVKRYENLANTDAITKKQLEDAQKGYSIAEAQFSALQKRLDDTQIKAPISGYINEEYYEMGALVSPGMPIADLINTSALKLTVKVTENEISKVKRGDQISVRVNAIKGETFTGKVDFISKKADGAFKYEVIILMNGSNLDKISPGMFGTAAFQFAQEGKVLQISRKAIAGSLKDPGVYTIKDGRAVYKPIKINPLNEGTIEVIEGLSANDEVIVSGLINVKEGTPVKVQ
jgi:membrane fusion protein (multidrug efflux system)